MKTNVGAEISSAGARQRGASLGFHPPLDPLEAAAYWRTVAADLAGGSRLLVVVESEGEVVGSGQLTLVPGTVLRLRHHWQQDVHQDRDSRPGVE